MCQGQIYRFEAFATDRGAGFRLRLVKRLSCQGCPACAVVTSGMEKIGRGMVIKDLGTAQHGKLYKINMKEE
jgi:hypothetical protein